MSLCYQSPERCVCQEPNHTPAPEPEQAACFEISAAQEQLASTAARSSDAGSALQSAGAYGSAASGPDEGESAWSGPTWEAGERDGSELYFDGSLASYDDGYNTLEVYHAQGSHGVWGDPGKDARIGAKAGVDQFKYSNRGGEELVGPGLSAEMSVGDDGFTVGASANLVSKSVTLGTPDAGSDSDWQARFGVGAGEGASARGHWGDADQDGHREYGFGFDAGPVSVDVKSEDPLKDYAKMYGPAGWALEFYDGNITSDVGDAWDWICD